MTAALHCLPKELQQWRHADLAGYHRPGMAGHPRVHLLHGNGFCALTLAGLARQLPADWSLWLTDVPGHGGSAQPNHKMPDWRAMAATVADGVARQANVAGDGPVIGIGHSLGGVLTLLAADQHPEIFSRIVLLDPVLFAPEIVIAQRLMRLSGAWRHTALVKKVGKRRAHWPDAEAMAAELGQKALYRHWPAEILRDFIDGGTQRLPDGSVQLACDPRWEASIFGSYPKGLWHAVRKVRVPVDILVADNSYGFIPRAARRAAKLNVNVRWHAFGNSHCFPMAQPAETAHHLQRLIAAQTAN